MNIYLLFTLSPLIVGAFFKLYYKRPISSDLRIKKTYLWICGFLTFLMLALRYEGVGSGDGYIYAGLWEQISKLSLSGFLRFIKSNDMEKGFLTSIWLLSRVFKDPQYVFIFSGAFCAFSVCRYLYLNCDDAVIGMMFFICIGLFGFMAQGIRQALAMCICLFSIEYVKGRQLIPFCLCIAAAVLFHGSAIVFLPVYFLFGLKINVPNVISMMLATAAAMMLMHYVFDVINFFIRDTYSAEGAPEAAGGTLTMLFYIAVSVLGFVFAGDKHLDKTYSFFFYLTVISTIVFALRFVVIEIAERISLFYSFSMLISLPAAISQTKKKERMVFSFFAILALCAFGIHKCQTSILVPYYFFWQI